MSTGTVKWFDGGKGYGFIVADDGGADLFVHHSEIKTEGYAGLDEGQKVNYTVGQGKKGPCATNVVPQQTNAVPQQINAVPQQTDVVSQQTIAS
jgi:CspA family cold shock protein